MLQLQLGASPLVVAPSNGASSKNTMSTSSNRKGKRAEFPMTLISLDIGKIPYRVIAESSKSCCSYN
jgi:hypothetical protein